MKIETLNVADTVHRFLITANWPCSKVRLTGREQDIFFQVLPRLKFAARDVLFSSEQAGRLWESRENRVFEPVERKENWSTNKRMVSTNEPAELTRIEPGGKKFHDAFNSGRVSNFCSISPSDFSRTRAKTCLCIGYTLCISNYTHFQLCISIKNNCELRSNARKKKVKSSTTETRCIFLVGGISNYPWN